ncbi:hypothetical protein XELAEV_18034110mg [Xenopus laevis]|uniref:Uncharacterized protein n=1 Tax=Xenopus laevis TaxID=8355 RepID=A0A974CLX1_XENLA|nr:hypothetical protein XELAEV_18034110mg [Xenopus laevis]
MVPQQLLNVLCLRSPCNIKILATSNHNSHMETWEGAMVMAIILMVLPFSSQYLASPSTGSPTPRQP